jgi:hypothetical protein
MLVTTREWIKQARLWKEGNEMTEAEWLASTDPGRMLDFLDGISSRIQDSVVIDLPRRRADPRKCRLFCCACHYLNLVQPGYTPCTHAGDRCSYSAVLASDGREDPWAQTPYSLAFAWCNVREYLPEKAALLRDLFDPFQTTKLPGCKTCGGKGKVPVPYSFAELEDYRRRKYGNVRHVIEHGPLPRHATCPNCMGEPYPCLLWHDGTVPKLARAAYEERAEDGRLSHDLLSLLADALEEAGVHVEEEVPCPVCGEYRGKPNPFGGKAGYYPERDPASGRHEGGWTNCKTCNSGGSRFHKPGFVLRPNPLLAHLRARCRRCKGRGWISRRTSDDGVGRSTVTEDCPDCHKTGIATHVPGCHVVDMILEKS